MAAPILYNDLDKLLPTLLVLVKNVADSMVESILQCSSEFESTLGTSFTLSNHVNRVHDALVHMNTLIIVALHDFRLAHAKVLLDEELGF